MQLITNHDELHVYAAGKVVEGLRRGASGDALLGAAAYLLGERVRQGLDAPQASACRVSLAFLLYRPGSKILSDAVDSAGFSAQVAEVRMQRLLQ